MTQNIIHPCAPETNHVSMVHNVVAILQLQFMVHTLLFPMLSVLYFYISTFLSMCVVPTLAVFCSSLTQYFRGMSFWYFVNDSEMVPVALLLLVTLLFFTFLMRCICCKAFIFQHLHSSFLNPIIIIIIIIIIGLLTVARYAKLANITSKIHIIIILLAVTAKDCHEQKLWTHLCSPSHCISHPSLQ